MEDVTIMAMFPDGETARAAARELARNDMQATVSAGGEGREAGFMLRLVKWIVFWSVIGTAIGAGLGALLSYTVGPHGRDGFILLVVSWAIFAHLLIGMWAGYVLLADRSDSDLALPGATLIVSVDRPEVAGLTDWLREAGATSVRVRGFTEAQPASWR